MSTNIAQSKPPPKSQNFQYNSNNNNRQITNPFQNRNQPHSIMQNNENNQLNNEENNTKESYESKYKKYNCSKDYLRTTINVFPNNEKQLNQLSIPIGLYLSPSSLYTQEGDIPIIDYGDRNDVPRCQNEKCRAFINPFIKIFNEQNKWECNLCKNVNEIGDNFYDTMDNNGMPIDPDNKIELNYGSYEFELNKSYWKNKREPNKLNYYFLVDISYKAIQSGFSQCVLETIKDCINNGYFFNYDIFDIKTCLITYDTSIHFYSINNKNNNQFTMFCMTDKDIFIPTNKDNIFVSIKENKNILIQIIESIQNNISNNLLSNEKPEIKDATRIFDAIKSVNILGQLEGGKIMLFSGSNISSLEMMNASKNNEGNNNNNNININLTRGASKLSQLGIDVTYNNLSINVFQSCNELIKLVFLNQLCENSNGNIYFYKNFNPDKHYKNIYNQIKRVLTNEMQLEGTLKLRLSNGFYISEYMTSVLLYNRKLFVFPCNDVDQKYYVSLSLPSQEELEDRDEIIKTDNEYMYIQSCLLYSYGDGRRRMRVHNLCLPISSNNKDIFESIDVECLSAFFVEKLTHSIYRTKNLTNSVIKIENLFYNLMNEYFNNLNSFKRELNSDMQLFILYFLGIMKLCLYNKNNDKGFLNDIDLSNYYRLRLLKYSIEEILSFLYPAIYILDDCPKLNDGEFPEILPDTLNSLNQGNLFLIDNGFCLSLYFRKNINNKIINDIFGVNFFSDIDYLNVNENNIFDNENDNNNNNYGEYKNKIREIIDCIRGRKSLYQDLFFVFEGINDEQLYKEILVEDNYNKNYPYDYNKFYEKVISGNK